MTRERRSSAINLPRRSTPLVSISFLLQCLAVGDSKISQSVSPEFSLPHAIPPLSRWQAPVSASASDAFSRRGTIYTQHHLQLDPPYLDFNEQPVGMPKIETVAIHNLHERQSLHLNSISGNTQHFHSSFFEAKVVPAGQKTLFQVIFLARMIGNAENTLYLHTSQGVIPFQVFGTGVTNPYRLRPFLGARVLVNTSYSPTIKMHNPHGSTLKVTEMYTSHGDLHLELPKLDERRKEEPLKKIWEIGPYQTKTVMKAKFIGRVVNNHTAFIRIKTNMEQNKRSEIVLPVEVEVTDYGGILSNFDVLDFGTVRTIDEIISLHLQLLNTGPRPVEVKSITVEPPNEAISFYFKPVVLKSTFPKRVPEDIATIHYNPGKANVRRLQYGKVILSTSDEQMQKIEIPYQANVLQGVLYASLQKAAFLLQPPPFKAVIQDIELTNTFDFPLAIYDAEFPSDVTLFEVVEFLPPVVIPSSARVSPLKVRFTPNSSDIDVSTFLRLFTNASVFTVPIHTYSGKMKYHVDGGNEDVLDYGTVNLLFETEMTFRVTNRNPVPITILNWSSSLKNVKVTLLGTQPAAHQFKGLPNTNRGKQPQQSKQSNVTVMSNYSAVFSAKLKPPSSDVNQSGEIIVNTTYMTLHVPIYYKIALGHLEASSPVVKFKNAFPGRVETKTVSVVSTFKNAVRLHIVETPNPPDSRLKFVLKSQGTFTIGNGETELGWFKVDPMLGKASTHYVGLTAQGVSDRKTWLSRLTLRHEAAVADTSDHEKLMALWENLEKTEKNQFSVSYKIKADAGVTFPISAQAIMSWPLVTAADTLKFPLTHIGNSTVMSVRIENPADVVLVVQAVMLPNYPNPELALDLLSERMGTDAYVMNTHDDSTFRLPDARAHHTSGANSETASRSSLYSMLGVETSNAAVTVVVEPRGHTMINVEFSPRSQKTVTSLLIVRNNLTIMDGVIVQGQGVLSMFTLDGRDPGNDHMPLYFNFTASYLAKCNESSSRSFTLKKTFTAKNTGQLPIDVISIEISGRSCASYGFVVKKCKPFTIKPNTTHQIEIEFTPDFTLSRISRKLDIVTSTGRHLEFNLLATLPHHLLPVYLASFPRPSWEPYFNTTLFIVMVVILVVVLVQAYFAAVAYTTRLRPERDTELCMKSRNSGNPFAGQVFDLNKIAGVGQSVSATTKDEKLNGEIVESVEFVHVEEGQVGEEIQTSETEKNATVETKGTSCVSSKPVERQAGIGLNRVDKQDVQTVNHSVVEAGKASVDTEKGEKQPTASVVSQKTSVQVVVEKDKEKSSVSTVHVQQDLDTKKHKQTKKTSASLPTLHDSIVMETTAKHGNRRTQENGNELQIKHDVQQPKKEEKLVIKDATSGRKEELQSRAALISRDDVFTVQSLDQREISIPASSFKTDELTRKEISKTKRKLKPVKVVEKTEKQKTDGVTSAIENGGKALSSRKTSHVSEKDGMKELDQLLIGNMPKSPVLKRPRLKSDEDGKRASGLKKQESVGEKKVERKQETSDAVVSCVGEKQEKLTTTTDALAGCPPGMKLEPLSGLNQHKISTDSMPLEDASIVEIGLSVISTEKSEPLPLSSVSSSRGPEAAMNGLAALSDTKRVDKTTKSKVSVVPSKSPMQVPTVGEASVAMETTQKTIVKDIKEPRARVAKSGIKQVGLKAKSEVSSVDPVPDPHAIATVIAASVAASTVKQGKNDEQSANCSSPRNVDKVAVLSGSMMGHMGEREKVEMEKQTYSRGKSRTTDGKSSRKQPKSPAKPNRLLKAKEKKLQLEKEAREQRKLSSEQLFERYLSSDLPEFIPKQVQSTSDTVVIEGETDSSSSDKMSPISAEMMDIQPQLPSSMATWQPSAFSAATSVSSYKESQQEERSVSPPERMPTEGMTREMYLSLLAQQQRNRSFGSAALDPLLSPLGNGSKGLFPGDHPSTLSDYPFSGALFDDPDAEYWLSRMAMRRHRSPPDILDDVPDMRSRSNSQDARSPSPHGCGDLSDSQLPILYHHGSRVIPRRRNNPIWDQTVGRSGHGLVRMSHNLRDDPYDAFSFPQERGNERRRFQGFARGRSPEWMSCIDRDFDPSLLTDLPATSSAYLWGDSADLDSLALQQEEMADVLRSRRSTSRRIRRDRDSNPDDYFSHSRLPSSGRLMSPHTDPPPLLNEYYLRSAALAGVRDSDVWSAAVEKQRREQSKYVSFPSTHQGRPRYPFYPGESAGLWDTPMSSEPTDEGWDTRLSSIWSRDPTELVPQVPTAVKDHGAIGEDKSEVVRREMSRDSSSSDLELLTAPLTVDSEKGSPQDPVPTTSTYDPFMSDIWGPSMARSWLPKEGGE